MTVKTGTKVGLGLVAGFLALASCGACGSALSSGRYNTPGASHAQLPNAGAPAAPAVAALPPGYVSGDGTLIVGTDIAPGTYRTPGPPAGEVMPYCYWKRLKDFNGGLSSIIVSGVASREGQSQVVTVSPGDAAFETSRCQPWQKIK